MPESFAVALNWGYRIEFLERRCEGVREAPQCARFEFRMSQPEVKIVDLPSQVLETLDCVPDRLFLGARRWRKRSASHVSHLW
jgi:hypothetical protein